MPLTARRMTSSGRRSSMSSSVRVLGRPGSRSGGSSVLSARLLPVTEIFSALTTTTKSPVSTCGVYSGLRLPRSASAICGRQAAERLPGGVDDEPVALAVVGVGDVGLHGVKKPRGGARRRSMIGKSARARIRRPDDRICGELPRCRRGSPRSRAPGQATPPLRGPKRRVPATADTSRVARAPAARAADELASPAQEAPAGARHRAHGRTPPPPPPPPAPSRRADPRAPSASVLGQLSALVDGKRRGAGPSAFHRRAGSSVVPAGTHPPPTCKQGLRARAPAGRAHLGQPS